MPLFATATHDAVEATRADIPAMQAYLEANPGYTRMIEERPVRPDAAAIEFDERPPPGLSFRRVRWLLLRERASAAVDGLASVVEDLLAPGIWHIGLFLVAEARHGSGLAQQLHGALEDRAAASGARWLRLGVASVNQRGARFWRGCGYRYVCARDAEARGGRVFTAWILVKPLVAADLAGYYAVQARDTPQDEPAGWQAISAR